MRETVGQVVNGMAAQVVVVSLIIAIGMLAVAGSVSPVEAIVSIGLLLRFTQILVDIGTLTSAFETRRPVLDLSHEILSAPELPAPTGARSVDEAPASSGASVALQDVSFSYEADHPVLHSVSFRVEPETMTAIVGPSGCGKTTIARLIARFYDVDAGSVRVCDEDVRDWDTADLMAQLSLVFQDVYLFDDTLEANVRVGNPDATRADIEEAARLSGVSEIVERLPHGWDTPVGEGGRALSGGERQRVSIARALLKAAPIVLFDEATSALDPENESRITDAMAALRRDATLIVIAHKLDTITAADQIVVLNESGRVARSARTQSSTRRRTASTEPSGTRARGHRGGSSSDGYHAARPGPQREAGGKLGCRVHTSSPRTPARSGTSFPGRPRGRPRPRAPGCAGRSLVRAVGPGLAHLPVCHRWGVRTTGLGLAHLPICHRWAPQAGPGLAYPGVCRALACSRGRPRPRL